jgi:hypothetical protein
MRLETGGGATSKSGRSAHRFGEIMSGEAAVAAWIFQAVPEEYDLKRALADLSDDVWLARQRHDAMAPGQMVYFWLARKGGGIVAVGEVTSHAEIIPAPSWQLPYWQPSARHAAAHAERRVRVTYRKRFPYTPLGRDLLSCDPILARQRPIGPVYVGTNFAVGSDAAKRLQHFVDTRT